MLIKKLYRCVSNKRCLMTVIRFTLAVSTKRLRAKCCICFKPLAKPEIESWLWILAVSMSMPLSDQSSDIASLSPYLTKYVSHVFALGKDAHLFEKSFAHTTRVATMKDAVKAATRLAAPGDVVLLSPACASLDMFKNYMHRGDVFKQDVHDLLNLHSKNDDAVEATS